MDNPHRNNASAANLSATFVPGTQNDDYYMPVVAPIPQRSMPEVPEQIQENIANLELNLRSPSLTSDSPSPNMHQSQFSQGYGYGGPAGQRQPSGPYNHTSPSPHQVYSQPAQSRPSPRPSSRPSPRSTPQLASQNPTHLPPLSTRPEDEPSFSPFPHIRDSPPNVPPRADEKESILEGARNTVLTSNDPEMQLAWAQDTLAFVDTALENDGRMSEAGHGRSVTPPIEHQLRIDAVSIVTFLSDQHHPKAEFLRGMWLEFGKFGHECDKREAYRCYSRAAQNGYARAEYRMGMQFESSNEIDKAIKHYERGIQGQDAASYYRMGMMSLLAQHGHPQDVRKGLDYIKFSADNADENAPQGSYVYGMLFARELPQVNIPDSFLPRDIDTAHYYIEKAAYLGFAKAQVRIGTAYELTQLNCPFDPVYSLHYNNLAARQGEPEAEMAISKWFLSGYEGVFSKNEAVSYEYALRAAQAGFPTAEFAMGYFNEVGIHVSTNLSEAKYWYGKAAEHGNEDAKGRISGISRSKTLSRKDHDRLALAKIKSVRGRPENRQAQPQVNEEPSRPAVTMPHPNYYIQSPGTNEYSSFNQNPFDSPTQPTHTAYGQNNYPPASANSSTPANDPYGYGRPNTSVQPNIPLHPANRPGSAVSSLGSNPSGNYGPSPTSAPTPNAYRAPQNNSPNPTYGGRNSSLPQGYRVSSGGLPASPAPGRQNYQQNKPLPNPTPLGADFGFTAPPDLTGADRRRVPSGPGPVGPGPAGPGAGRPLPGRDPRPDRKATPQQPPSGGSTPSTSSQRPPRQEQLPTRPHPGTYGSPAVPTPPPANLGASKPPGGSAAPQKRPGKGPSTFEEMGVPVAKQENDCVIM